MHGKDAREALMASGFFSTNGHTDKQADREADQQIGTQTVNQADRQRYREAEWTERHAKTAREASMVSDFLQTDRREDI